MTAALWVIAVCTVIRIIQNGIQLSCLLASKKAEKFHLDMLKKLNERINDAELELDDYKHNTQEILSNLREYKRSAGAENGKII